MFVYKFFSLEVQFGLSAIGLKFRQEQGSKLKKNVEGGGGRFPCSGTELCTDCV